MVERALSPTSYVVLGLVRTLQPCTSYDMKQLVKVSIGMFWSFPHSQLYAEPARLVDDGLLSEDQEAGGRRRRLFRLTPAGADALRDWLTDNDDPAVGELRDDGLLRLFFSDAVDSAEVRELAEARRTVHEERVEFLTNLREQVSSRATPAQLATLELGLRWYRTAADFWAEIAEPPDASSTPDRSGP